MDEVWHPSIKGAAGLCVIRIGATIKILTVGRGSFSNQRLAELRIDRLLAGATPGNRFHRGFVESWDSRILWRTGKDNGHGLVGPRAGFSQNRAHSWTSARSGWKGIRHLFWIILTRIERFAFVLEDCVREFSLRRIVATRRFLSHLRPKKKKKKKHYKFFKWNTHDIMKKKIWSYLKNIYVILVLLWKRAVFEILIITLSILINFYSKLFMVHVQQ